MRLRNFAKFLAFVLVVLGCVVAVLKTWFVSMVDIGHDGMAPTLIAGDAVLVWRDATIQHGDVVLCRHPTEEGRWVLGRVLGRNGTRLAVSRGQLSIEGTVPSIDYRGEVDFVDHADGTRAHMRWGFEHLGNDDHLVFIRSDRTLRMRPTGDYDGLYLVGDNRLYAGEDSRTFGPVAESACLGQVFMRVRMSPDTPPEIGSGRFDFIR